MQLHEACPQHRPDQGGPTGRRVSQSFGLHLADDAGTQKFSGLSRLTPVPWACTAMIEMRFLDHRSFYTSYFLWWGLARLPLFDQQQFLVSPMFTQLKVANQKNQSMGSFVCCRRYVQLCTCVHGKQVHGSTPRWIEGAHRSMASSRLNQLSSQGRSEWWTNNQPIDHHEPPQSVASLIMSKHHLVWRSPTCVTPYPSLAVYRCFPLVMVHGSWFQPMVGMAMDTDGSLVDGSFVVSIDSWQWVWGYCRLIKRQ